MVRSRMAVRRKPRSRSRLHWAGLTVAPWCLAVGLIVSFVADAGQDPVIGATRMDLTDLAPGMPADLVPPSAADFKLPPHDAGLWHQARLIVGETDEIAALPDEIEPRTTLKLSRSDWPQIDRTHRGDPLVSLRPTFDTLLRQPGSVPAYQLADTTFADADPTAPALIAGDLATEALEIGGLEPMPSRLTITTRHSEAAASPSSAPGSTTPHVQDGSTPLVARAVSLASTTPAPADGAPVEIGLLPKWSRGPKGVVTGNTTMVGIAPPHPDFTAFMDGAKAASEQRCLAQAIYFEARSEPEEGQAAVAQVVLNRAMSGLYPSSVCAVVFQNQQRRNACQFSFACEGKALRVTESESWASAVRIAREVTEGSAYVSDVGGSTHYHANYVRPFWARTLTKMDVIGHHVFYKLKPGQT